METATLVIAITSLILTLFSLGGSIAALALIIGLKNSTHQVQYMPIEDVVNEKDKKVEETVEDLYEHLT